MQTLICCYSKTLLNCLPGNCRMMPCISRSESVARTSEEFKLEGSTWIPVPSTPIARALASIAPDAEAREIQYLRLAANLEHDRRIVDCKSVCGYRVQEGAAGNFLNARQFLLGPLEGLLLCDRLRDLSRDSRSGRVPRKAPSGESAVNPRASQAKEASSRIAWRACVMLIHLPSSQR